MKNEKEFYKKFKPQLTPKRMLELGVFGGAYFVDGSVREFPKSWFANAKLSKTFDVNLNRFKIESGLSRKEWIAKGWIFKEDPLGWFQWYCRFKNGEKPYKLQLVGMELGGKPIEDYANDFYLISHSKGGKPVGYITSP